MNRRISIIVMNREAEDRLLKLLPSPTETEAGAVVEGDDRDRSGAALTSRMRVLVVDDFWTMRRVLRGLLREIGFADVDEAGDGLAALEQLRAAPSTSSSPTSRCRR